MFYMEWFTAIAILATTLIVCRFTLRSRRTFPPGPPSLPIIGNILSVPPQAPWIPFTKFRDVYGELVFFHGLGNHVLVLNSMRAITDLLEKRATVYSDRPSFTVVGELMGLGQSMPLLPYDDEWRAHRKLAHNALSPSAVKRYHTVQEDLAALLGQQLLSEPEDFFSHVRLAASRLILVITYGLSVETADDEYIAHAEDTMHMISKATVPGAYLCDLIPIMKHLPRWFQFQREAKVGRGMIDRMVTKPFEHVKAQMRSGDAPPSLTHQLLSMESPDISNLEHRVKWTTGALYGAGGETTYATVLTCMMAMALHPGFQKLAQEEIDRVVGKDRLPRISDRSQLPYVNAVIKETMRWHPALPLSIARCTTKDDIYEGYFIPKGTIVMPNAWAIAFTTQDGRDATAFDPERFLHPSAWAFGFARRLCPGKHLAENSVFILIATILAAFDIAPPESGRLKVEFTKGLVSYPEPFRCRITPRSPARASQVMSRAECASV